MKDKLKDVMRLTVLHLKLRSSTCVILNIRLNEQGLRNSTGVLRAEGRNGSLGIAQGREEFL